MNWKDVLIWFLQFGLIELFKRWPKIGDWVKKNVPAVLAAVSIVIEIIEQALGLVTSPPAATAATAPDSTITVVAVTSTGGIIVPAINNAIGTLLVENVVKKFLFRWLFKQVIYSGVIKKFA